MKGTIGWKSGAILLWVSIMGALSSCGDDGKMNNLQKYIQHVRSEPPRPLSPIPEFASYQGFKYSSQNLPSPFQPMVASVDLSNKPDTHRAKEMLEDYSTDVLQILGSIKIDNQTWALVKAPSGIIYRVTVGNHMGQHFGRIDQITDQGVILTETIPNPAAGGWMKRTIELGFGPNANNNSTTPNSK